MLLQLEIQNIALIDRISIEPGEGLNILTGETGAGKSIIIDSINAILGERVSRELIRTGRERAVVEAVFQVDNARLSDIFDSMGLEPEEDGTLILTREFSVSGKNTCRINGKLATVSMLKEFGTHLIDVHGQHDNQSLLHAESHIDLLDSFAGVAMEQTKAEYRRQLAGYRSLQAKLKSLSGNTQERQRKIDLLKFQIDEIKKAKLKRGEEEELNQQRLALSNAGKIMSSYSAAYQLLFEGSGKSSSTRDTIGEAISELSAAARYDESSGSLVKRLEDVSYQLDDIIDEIRKTRDGEEFNPEQLEQVEERLDLIYRLKRKYGTSIPEILAYGAQVEEELKEVVNSEELAASIQQQLHQLDTELFRMAEKLHEERIKAAELLESEIGSQLTDLEMRKARFKADIVLDMQEDTVGGRKYGNNGLDRVEFLISANAGEPLKPLARIASGGEMSRIMLAIKTILADVDQVPTLIFDEIDIGISGVAAQKVGEKLSRISRNHQVICVTHLAQIACAADHHYLIEKVSKEDSTHTVVTRLEGRAVQKEIARILGGASITETTLKHAGEMLEFGRRLKTS